MLRVYNVYNLIFDVETVKSNISNPIKVQKWQQSLSSVKIFFMADVREVASTEYNLASHSYVVALV